MGAIADLVRKRLLPNATSIELGGNAGDCSVVEAALAEQQQQQKRRLLDAESRQGPLSA